MYWILVFVVVSPIVDGLDTTENPEDSQTTPVVPHKCVLPDYPEKGSYIVVNQTEAGPGDVFDDVTLMQYTSDEYFVLQIESMVCSRGTWSREIFKRVPRPNTLKRLNNEEEGLKTRDQKGANRERCKLPPYPTYGDYVVAGDADAEPGDELQSARLEYTCAEGYILVGKKHIQCENGMWEDDAPDCFEIIEVQESRSKIKTQLPTQNKSNICEFPPKPEHGSYSIQSYSVDSNDNVNYFHLYYYCYDDYTNIGYNDAFCLYGVWLQNPPTCVKGCRLDKRVGDVLYLCKEQHPGEYSQKCSQYLSPQTLVIPLCNTPHFRSSKLLPPMKCIDGNWNYVPVCSPECGLKGNTEAGKKTLPPPQNATGGKAVFNTRELPWHVQIYEKLERSHKQICAGSLISAESLITAAHCFWKEPRGLQHSSQYAVGAGKSQQAWDTKSDTFAQFRDVNSIEIPEKFQGAKNNFQYDIAIVYVEKPFEINLLVGFVCVDFDVNFDRTQLTAGNSGEVGGWNLVRNIDVLEVVNFPYVEIDQCINDASPDFRSYITSDKICAGYTNGKALCNGNSGGGLVYPKVEKWYLRYYLRGVASVAPDDDQRCANRSVSTFTHILAHEHFVKYHLSLTSV